MRRMNTYRITLNLSPDQYTALRRVATALDESMSGVVAELIGEHIPIFDRMSEALEASKRLNAVAIQTKRAGFQASSEKAMAHYQKAIEAFHEATDPLIAAASSVPPTNSERK
jgi:hypothetical protein